MRIYLLEFIFNPLESLAKKLRQRWKIYILINVHINHEISLKPVECINSDSISFKFIGSPYLTTAV